MSQEHNQFIIRHHFKWIRVSEKIFQRIIGINWQWNSAQNGVGKLSESDLWTFLAEKNWWKSDDFGWKSQNIRILYKNGWTSSLFSPRWIRYLNVLRHSANIIRFFYPLFSQKLPFRINRRQHLTCCSHFCASSRTITQFLPFQSINSCIVTYWIIIKVHQSNMSRFIFH